MSAAPSAMPLAPEVVLADESAPLPLAELVKRKRLTVLFFFSADCPVQKAHDARMRELIALYEPRGVSFAAIVSESGANLSTEKKVGIHAGPNISLFHLEGQLFFAEPTTWAVALYVRVPVGLIARVLWEPAREE